MSFGFRVSGSGFFATAAILLLGSINSIAQSTDQNFPTPLTTSEAAGTIRARDLGDSRLTTYFFAFDGGQGDIFINAVTQNFSGDIDVFTADSMTPLAKMVIYADTDRSETGRLIYLRKPERLLLRVQGRTPNDDAATFRVRFGGSFIALESQKEVAPPTVARTDPNEPGVKVNDAGKIVAIVPKPQPSPKQTAVSSPPPAKSEGTPAKTATAKVTPPKPAAKKPDDASKKTVLENDTAKVTVEEPKPTEREPTNAPKPAAKTPVKKPAAGRNASVNERAPKAPPKRSEPTKAEEKDTQAGSPRSDKPADALASIRLVIQMKNGTTFWTPMNEVLKFTVDKGIMTVVKKDGGITRYNILDVEKTTIQ